MKYFREGLSEKHKELSSLIRKKDKLEQSKMLFMEIHSCLHLSEVSGTELNEVDKVLKDLQDSDYAIMLTSKDETIAWAIWHIARIEDLTMNCLVGKRDQVFSDEWQQKLNVSITDTGNALTDDEIMDLSININKKELLAYRYAVGKRTREIVCNLTIEDMKRKVDSNDLKKILQCGGVTEHKDSIWLLDFWGNKDVAGILLMPPTRHVMLHLNDCCKWKEQIQTKNKYFRS
jgi:hypothetical protein